MRLYEEIQECRQCKSTQLSEVLSLGTLPLAGRFIKENQIPEEPLFPLTLVQCAECDCVQVKEKIDPEFLFSDYRYTSSSSPGLVRHFQQSAKEMDSLFSDKKSILEIGSNDGVFIRPLIQTHFSRIHAVDPASNIIALVPDHEKIHKHNAFFSSTFAKEIVETHGKVDVITSSNVLAHIESMYDVFEGIRILLDEKGHVVMEVQHLAKLLEGFQYDFIYHEHIFYYSLASLQKILALHSLEIYDCKQIPIHGGSLQVYFGHKGAHQINEKSINEIKNYEEKVLPQLKTFQDEINKNVSDIQQLLKEYEGKKVVAYGASGRSVTQLNVAGVKKEQISYFIDDSKERANRVFPGIHIPIYEKTKLEGEDIDLLIITAWTFKDDIIKKVRQLENTTVKETAVLLPEVKKLD